MDLRARLALSVMIAASIAVAATGCKHDTLGSGTQGLTVTFVPGAVNTRFEDGSFGISRFEVLPADPATATVYGAGRTLLLRFDALDSIPFLTGEATFFSQIALPVGDYKVTKLIITHPVFAQRTTSPTPPFAHCSDGLQYLVPSGPPTTFTESDGITFTVRPGQTTLSIKLDLEHFIPAYLLCFEPSCSCIPPGPCFGTTVDEAAFRVAVLSNLKIE